jgi:hypothetical protein
VQVAIGMDWRLLDGMVRYLFREGSIPEEFTVQDGAIAVHLQEPRIAVVVTLSGGESLALLVRGMFSLGSAQPTVFSVSVLLEPTVVKKPSDPPFASFVMNGIQDAVPANLAALLGDFVQTLLSELLQKLAIPIYEPLIKALAPAYFGDTPPLAEQWSLGFSLGHAGILERDHREPWQAFYVDSLQVESTLVATVALPGENAILPGNPGITPHGTGLQILISKAAMNAMLRHNANRSVGKSVGEATIKSLTMAMVDHGIEIHGAVEKSGASVTWDGIIYLYFHNFYTSLKTGAVVKWRGPFSENGYLEVATSGIKVDIDIPWYVKVFQGLLSFLGPIGGIINHMVVGTKLEEAEGVPDLVRNSLGVQVREAFEGMVAKFSGISDPGQPPFVMLGSDAWIAQGNYAYTFKAFGGYNEARITGIDYDRFKLTGVEGKSVGYFHLDSGHKLAATEAGMLMKRGALKIPGYHGVRAPYGFYVRANPNQQGSDNLVPPEEIIVHK